MAILFCADLCKNHGGDLTIAIRMVLAACAAGADIVKLQADDGLDMEMHSRLFGLIHDSGKEAALTIREPEDLLADEADYLKIGSGECLNGWLIEHVRRDGRPWIISTGGTTQEQFYDILIRASGPGGAYAVCECTSSYPELPDEVRLGFMSVAGWPYMGYSDHMPSIHMALGAVALGAVYVEKHLSLSPMLPGANHNSSIDQVELAQLVKHGTEIHAALKNKHKSVVLRELTTGKLLEYRERYLA